MKVQTDMQFNVKFLFKEYQHVVEFDIQHLNGKAIQKISNVCVDCHSKFYLYNSMQQRK
jgi:hypothetical protein